jgi:nucleoside-diphosphate-sugar epimerase
MHTLTADDVVVLTGATGFTGRAITRQLLQTGCTLRLLVRASSDTREFEEHPQVTVLRGELHDEAFVASACRDCHYLFHLAAAFREKALTQVHYRQVHITSTQLLAKAVSEQAGFRRFVHVSTVGVHGLIEQAPANEDYRFSPSDSYQATKAEAELWIRQYAADCELPLTVIRPVAVMGPGDARLRRMFRLARLPVVPMLGLSSSLYHLIHVDDLARCVIAAANPALPREAIYIAGNREASSARQIITAAATELGRQARFIHLPSWPFHLAALVVEKLFAVLGKEPPIRRRQLAMLTRDRAFDTSRMQATFGDLLHHDNASGLEETVRWYRSQGLL